MSDQRSLRQELVPLIKMLASDQDGEVLAAVRAIKRKLKAAGRDLNDLANEIGKSPQRRVTLPEGTVIIIKRH